LPEFELFEDFSSLLPNRIDLDDLLNENKASEGFKAARNFLAIAGLDAQFFKQQDSRILKQKIENLNGDITLDFQDYWRQSVGKDNKIRIYFELEHYDISNPEKKGKPYIEFWIKDERERLYPKQRSRGVRWFLSFYLELKATAKKSKKEKILLIDEPGLSLHARAQEDVLKVFEDIKSQLSIIYTTHSPHLIDIHKLYRILAVQRADEDDEKSQTIILNTNQLMNASADTLSPIYTLMGARITDQQYIHKNNNIIVENASSFFLMKAYFTLMNFNKEAWFLPATSASNVELLANLLLGWKLDFIVILNGNEIGKNIGSALKKNIYGNNEDIASKKIIVMEDGMGLIDLLSTIDFKNHVLKRRVGITESNSDYIDLNDISSSLLAMNFNNQVQEHKIKIQDLDQESVSKIKKFVEQVISLVD
jgi:ABC-type ATPase involved in cell division